MIGLLNERLDAIRNACKAHYVKSLYVFGSAATGNFNADSDIDFLYRFDYDKIASLSNHQFDYAENLFDMEHQLAAIVGRKVDLIAEDAVANKILQQEVASSKKLLYAE